MDNDDLLYSYDSDNWVNMEPESFFNPDFRKKVSMNSSYGCLLVEGFMGYLGEVLLTSKVLEENKKDTTAYYFEKGEWSCVSYDLIELLEKEMKKRLYSNKIYYMVLANSKNHKFYINFMHPLTMDEAAKVLKKHTDLSVHSITTPFGEEYKVNSMECYKNGHRKYVNNPYHIYTFDQRDAAKLLFYCNTIPSTGRTSGNKKYYNYFCIPENHAFKDSYKNYFNYYTIPINGYVLDHNPPIKKLSPGFYFWHYHFDRKHLPNTKIPMEGHVFFGVPIFISNNDLNQLGNNHPFHLSELEMFHGDSSLLRDYLDNISTDVGNRILS